MANPLDANELIKQGNTRTFYQPGGPGTPSYFFGLDTEYHFLDSATIPTNGAIDPIFVPDPRAPGRYKLVGRKTSAPALPQIKIQFMEQWGGIPRILMAPKCEFNLYEVHGRCSDISDFNRGWEGYMMVYSGFKFNDTVDMGARSNASSDEMLADSANAVGIAAYPVGSLGFGEEAATNVVVEVIDVVYGTNVQCANCGNANDGSQFIYIVTRANVGSPSAPGQVVYSLDGGTTWNNSTVTGIGNTNQPTLIDIAGNVLFIVAGSALFYSVLDDFTGAPTTWQTITMPAAMVDVYVQAPTSIWFVSSTSIWKATDITIAPTLIDNASGATLHRIAGVNDLIVATGSAGTVRYSQSNGAGWVTATAPASTTLHAVAVMDEYTWFVGGNNGNVYKTTTKGASWSTLAFQNAGTGAISDIQIATREVIWIAQNISSVAYLVTTLDGGNSWIGNNAGSPRILNFPTFQQVSRLAIPKYADPAVAANYVTIGGLATGGADGILLTAGPTIK
jgi:hypothetical protein